MNPRQKRAIKQRIRNNKHQVFLVSFEEMDNIVQSSPKAKSQASIKEQWKKIRGKTEVGVGYYSSADDAVTLAKLVGDLGAVGTRAYIKTYKGKPHIILKGRPGLRKILTGTKYGIKNPKVVNIGLGRAGAVHAAKQGGIISIVLLTTFRVTDHFLSDNSTWSKLIGHLATDFVKVGIATGASIAAAYAMSAAFTVAIGPIAAIVVVGFFGSLGLQYIDDRYGITTRLVNLLDKMGKGTQKELTHLKYAAEQAINQSQESIIDYVVVSVQKIVINMIRHNINKFLSPVNIY